MGKHMSASADTTKLLTPGSSDYYAWRFTAPAWQAAWLALGGIQERLWDIVLHYREPSVAQAKLLWWAEEMARTAAGQPEHPQTQALLAALPEVTRVQGLLTEWIEGLMAAMLCQHLCTDTDFALMAKRSIAIPALLLCRYHDLQDAHTLTLASQQSELLLFDRYLSYRQRLLPQGQVWIPLQRLSRAELSPENLAQPEHTVAWLALNTTWLETLAADYKAHWHALTPQQQALLKYPHTLTRIAHRRCSRFLKKRQSTWTSPIKDLTPLSKLWLAI